LRIETAELEPANGLVICYIESGRPREISAHCRCAPDWSPQPGLHETRSWRSGSAHPRSSLPFGPASMTHGNAWLRGAARLKIQCVSNGPRSGTRPSHAGAATRSIRHDYVGTALGPPSWPPSWPAAGAHKGRPYDRLVTVQSTNKKSGAVSRPDTIHDFQFPE
jgi:hypothetical protein